MVALKTKILFCEFVHSHIVLVLDNSVITSSLGSLLVT